MTKTQTDQTPATDAPVQLTDHNMSKWSADLVRVLGNTWRMIQRRNPEVPDVVITIGIGRTRKSLTLGHFAAGSWENGNGRAHELMVGAEGLARGAEDVLCTLLHEAAHGIARSRIESAKKAGATTAEKDLQDTSRQGRWHNARFREIAKEIGLGYVTDESGCDCKPDSYKTLGWSAAILTDETAARYAVQIEQLRGSLIAHRVGYVAGGGGDGDDDGDDAGKVSGTVSLSCDCAKPRKIRVSRSTAEIAAIICGECTGDFRER